MSWTTIDTIRKWAGKRKGLLTGLVGVAIQETAALVPGGGIAVKILGEVAKYGVERLVDPQSDLPDVKPAGQAFPTEQLDQVNAWLEILSTSYAGLLDRLDSLTTVTGNEPLEQLTVLVKGTLQQHEDLAREFDRTARQVRHMTLSLARIEGRLEEVIHGYQKVGLAVEDFKNILEESPLMGDWAEFRKARPEAVQALNQADEHFLAGRREQGVQVYLDLLKQRGVGEGTLCRVLGVAVLAQGKPGEAQRYLKRSLQGPETMQARLLRTMTSLGAASQREVALPVWRSLPQGYLVERKYRIEAEVGRGGMASVYRAVCVDWVDQGKIVALKVPAPDLLADEAARRRFVQEIQVSRRLSGHPAIEGTLGHAVFDDPYTRQELYALVLEYIDGVNLAQFLEERKTQQKPLTPAEIVAVLQPVCKALIHAHGQNPPVLHRDLKPHNVMLTRQGQARLMDFGIARVLEEQREGLTNTSSAVGTLAYMPAEMLQGGAVLDARTDVYLAGNLLLELMTFSPFGDAESRGDCPEAWGELIADSMNRLRGKRPASMIVFLDRLLGEPEKRPAEPVRPVAKTLAQELEDLMKWTTEVHEEARRMAEKTQDYAGAARMLEALPEASRDAKLYGEICRRRDQVAELEKEVAEGVRTGRLAGLRPRVEEWLKLQPRRKGELQSLLEQLPKEVELPRELVNSIGMEFRKS